MADGVRLAADVILPEVSATGKLPTVLIQTRYWRSFRLRGGGGKGRVPQGPRENIVTRLLGAGFAVVVTDVRGTGASEGRWRWPWSAEEVADIGPVIDWIVSQPWSNGSIGATGVSYEGTTALLSAAAGRTALKAVLARQIEWDLVDETIAPGGVRNVAFVDTWSRSVNALDRGEYPEIFPGFAKWFVSGVQRVDRDPEGLELRAQQQSRTLAHVGARVAGVRHGDDPFGADGPPTNALGPSGHAQSLATSHAVIGVWGSWWDGATADAVFRARNALSIREAVIGPWDHEGTSNASPLRGSASTHTTVALDSVVAFFHRHLTARSNAPSSRVSWYVAGAESWRTASAWPVTQPRAWIVASANSTSRLLDAPVDITPGARNAHERVTDALPVDFSASTGLQNRWTSGLARRVDAPDRARASGLLSWRTAPLTEVLSVFGEGSLTCTVATDAPEAALHVYVESIDPRGGVRLLTEGTRRVRADESSPRETVVRIRPVAFELPRGWALRLSVAGADAPTFERVPESGAQAIRVSNCKLVLNTPIEASSAAP